MFAESTPQFRVLPRLCLVAVQAGRFCGDHERVQHQNLGDRAAYTLRRGPARNALYLCPVTFGK